MNTDKIKSGMDICKDAYDRLWCVEGLRYEDALKLIEDLNKIKGIYANITVGGVKISCGGYVEDMKVICEKHNAVPRKGLTMKVETVILRGDNKRKPLDDPGVKSTPESRAKAQEKKHANDKT